MTLINIAPDSPRARGQAWTRDAERMVRQKPASRTVGGWIADRVGQGKNVTLCPTCRPKFAERAHGYREAKHSPFHKGVDAKCDACRTFTRCAFLIPERLEGQI